MKDIVIIGAGGFAKEVAFLIDEINNDELEWNLLGFIDEEKQIKSKYSIINSDNWLINHKSELSVAFGIGNPELLSSIYEKIKKNKKLRFPNLIHPNCVGDWERIKLGKGNIICASNTFTTDIQIKDFNIINLDCTIGHDVKIGNFNVINPSVNMSGGVTIQNKVLLGTSSTILQYKNICDSTIIGAGAVVTKDIIESGIYIGSPAKKMIKE